MKAKSLLAAGLALCLLLSGCKEQIPQETATDPTTVTTAPTETTAPIKTHRVSGCSAESYTMDLTLDTQNNLICGTSTLKVTNNTNKALEKLCIRLYSASITSGVISKATNSATGQEYPIDVRIDPSVIYVNLLEEPLVARATMDLALEFETELPVLDERMGCIQDDNGKLYNMTFCFPTLAFHEDGQWNETEYVDFGESYCYEMTDYHVTLHAPEDYVVLSSGKAETKNGVTTIEAPNVREMAITACNFSTILSREINGVTINLMAADYAGYEEQYLSDLYHIMLTVAAESVELFSTKVGDYIYDELDVIPSKLESVGGMEMSGLVQVWMPLLDVEADSSIRMSNMSVVSTTHEVGHQWFYCAVSNDAFKEPWLDESFTSYLEYLYIDLFQEGKELMDSFNQKYVPDGHYWDSYRFSEAQGLDNDKPINLAYDQYDYLDYGMYVYESGAWFLRELELTMGSDRFFEMLSRWYAENLNQIVTGEAFIDHLLQYDSSEAVQQIIDEYISSEAL